MKTKYPQTEKKTIDEFESFLNEDKSYYSSSKMKEKNACLRKNHQLDSPEFICLILSIHTIYTKLKRTVHSWKKSDKFTFIHMVICPRY